jgi:protein ImuB
VERLEPLGFVLRGLLSRLVDRLDARGLACGPLELRLDLVGGRRDARRIGVAAPTTDVRILLRLVTLALEQRPPDAPVGAVSLATRGRTARRNQLDLFRPPGPAPEALSRTLAELEALCGEGRVGAPAVRDDHRDDAWDLRPFSPRPAGDTAVVERVAGPAPRVASAERRPGLHERRLGPEERKLGPEERRLGPEERKLGLRALRPPQPAEVTAPGGRPRWLRSRVASGRIVSLSGPFRTTGGWWSPERRYAFDHWDAETHDGAVVRLRFDHVARRWEIDGLYD